VLVDENPDAIAVMSRRLGKPTPVRP
jgi:hypothetical protein